MLPRMIFFFFFHFFSHYWPDLGRNIAKMMFFNFLNSFTIFFNLFGNREETLPGTIFFSLF